jgi:hypothetical protein
VTVHRRVDQGGTSHNEVGRVEVGAGVDQRVDRLDVAFCRREPSTPCRRRGHAPAHPRRPRAARARRDLSRRIARSCRFRRGHSRWHAPQAGSERPQATRS